MFCKMMITGNRFMQNPFKKYWRGDKLVHRQSFSCHVSKSRGRKDQTWKMPELGWWVWGCPFEPLPFCSAHILLPPTAPFGPPPLALQPPLLQHVPSSTFTCTHNRKLPRKHLIVVCLSHNHGG
jgi:hypothetical protein